MLSNKINKAQATHYFEDKNIVLKGRFAKRVGGHRKIRGREKG